VETGYISELPELV